MASVTFLDTYLAAAYWGPRRETVEDCARRASVFLALLSQASDYFTGWRPLGRVRPVAAKAEPIGQSQDALIELFLKGRNRRDIDGDVIDELGFRISVWNGRSDEEAASLVMNCGLYSPVSGLSNAIVLKLPPCFETTISESQVRQVTTTLAEAWDPDWAFFSSRSRFNIERDRGPFLDRALYVRSSTSSPRDLPVNVVNQEVAHGHLFVS